ncbi:phospholipid carrier-dependent glycosyltransferase, partial [Candidatus Parcubacteria bacterium]|nr:phospholipid carrier-dependent glycosyltransferase [Candidatus Parcubacteria bacterium]
AKRHKKEKLGIFLAIVYCLNPAIVFDSSFWGQTDSLLALFLFLTIYFFETKKPLFATFFFIISFFTKPQAIFLFPLFAFLFFQNFSFKDLFLSFVLALFLSFLLFFPFVKNDFLSFFIQYHLTRFHQYSFATANAFNFWMLFGGQTTLDNTPFFGLDYFKWGLILTSLFQILGIFLVFKNKDQPFWLYFGAFLIYFSSFFFFPRMHERYLIPALIFLLASLIWEEKLIPLFFALSFSIFANIYYIWKRAWWGTLNNDPLYIWVPKDDNIGIMIALFTLILFCYSWFFAFKKFGVLTLSRPKISLSDKDKNKLFIFIILILSFLTRFIFIWYPAEVVFDEVHYGKTVNGYLRGEYFFTGHPPFGSQLITIGALLGKYKGNFAFENIGEKFSDKSYVALRSVPAFFGALVPLVIYFFLLINGFPNFWAFFASLLLIFENSLLVQSKFILIDSFWIFFGFLGVLLFFLSQKKNYQFFTLSLSGFSLGLALATKWTSLSFFLFIFPFIFGDLLKAIFSRSFKSFLLILIKCFFGLGVFALLAYLLVFFVHFKFLPKSGPGDIFMSQEFLSGKKNFFEKVIELNIVCYETNIKGLTASHPYASKFYTWPLLLRPIYYWNGENQKIYFLGNPILWWCSTLAVIFLFILLVLNSKMRKEKRAILILWGYFASLLPYLKVTRITFL